MTSGSYPAQRTTSQLTASRSKTPVKIGVGALVGAGGSALMFGFGLWPVLIGASIGGGFVFMWQAVKAKVYGTNPAAEAIVNHLVQLQQKQLEDLKRNLSTHRFTEGVESISEEAYSQLGLFLKKAETYEELLHRKLSPRELMYERFVSIGRNVCGGILKNLQGVADRMEAMSGGRKPDPQSELYVGCGELLKINRDALDGFDNALESISALPARDLHGQGDLETALKDLEEIVRRAELSRKEMA